MEALTEIRGEQMILKLREVPEKYRAQLEEDYFLPDDDGYARAYPKDLPYMERIAQNFQRYGVDMFDRTRAADPAHWQHALHAFIERMEGTGLDWLLTGSCALAVRGIAIHPKDVDVVFPHFADLGRVRTLFANETILPLTECEHWVALGYGAAYLDFVVGMAFATQACLDQPDPIDSGPYALAHAETIEWQGCRVKVPPIALTRNINARRNRQERVRLIDEFMARQ